MKIDQQSIASTNSTQSAALNPFAAQRNSASSASGSDQAELSGVSKAIQSFQSDRTARIDHLTALVRSGKYDVSAAKISSAIVGEALNAGTQAAGVAAR